MPKSTIDLTLLKIAFKSFNHGQLTSFSTLLAVAVYVLRNDPGQLARTGISPGQRRGSVFG